MSVAAEKNRGVVENRLKRFPKQQKMLVAFLEESEQLSNTLLVYNLIATVVTSIMVTGDENLEKQLPDLSMELVHSFWDMSVWHSARYNSEVVLTGYRKRKKVQEGIYTCARCTSTRTFQRVKRASGDESIPIKIYCAQCPHSWTE